MNGLEKKLLVLKFNGVYALLLIYTPQYLLVCFFLCFGMLASAGPPFLSRCFGIICSTIERNLEYCRSVVDPGQEENIMNFRKCSLNCCPVILQECLCSPRSHPGSWLCFSWVCSTRLSSLAPGAGRRVSQQYSQAASLGSSPRCSHKLEGLPGLFDIPLRVMGLHVWKPMTAVEHYRLGQQITHYFCPHFSHNFSRVPKMLTEAHKTF